MFGTSSSELTMAIRVKVEELGVGGDHCCAGTNVVGTELSHEVRLLDKISGRPPTRSLVGGTLRQSQAHVAIGQNDAGGFHGLKMALSCLATYY